MAGSVESSSLGRVVVVPQSVDSGVLFAVSRAEQRQTLGLSEALSFFGVDIWNAYELSWLDSHGKPVVAIAEIVVSCFSPFLVESKSLKLFLFGFQGVRFDSVEQVSDRISGDLSHCCGMDVSVCLHDLSAQRYQVGVLQGVCLDGLDVELSADFYQAVHQARFLSVSGEVVTERLYTNLFKSNCPVTGQPDWASVVVQYKGRQIDHVGLFKYLLSFREHQAFHELCVEQIFCDLLKHCQPEVLTVYARFTRRGGIDINPWRSTEEDVAVDNLRLVRQ